MFNKLFGKKHELFPWAGKHSIYQFIQSQLDEHGKIVDEKLPDEDELFINEDIRFVPGALDSLFGDGDSKSNSNKMVNSLIKLIRQLLESHDNKTRRATYVKVMDGRIMEYIDPFLEELGNQADINASDLHEEALWFIKNSAHRSAVKFGIALLGTVDCEKDKEILLAIGKHEEFTLFSAVALINGTESPDENLFALAKSVDGWGKIHVVERLEPSTEEIKGWLLTDGCENSIMNEYLAYTCAVNGELHKILEKPDISYPLYQGAGKIISALICGGPAADIDDYEHASEILSRYLFHSIKHCTSLDDFLPIVDIQEFLGQDREAWEDRFKKGWCRRQKSILQKETENFFSNSFWKDKAFEEIESKDEQLYIPLRVARAFNVDIWPILFEKLKRNPLNDVLYFELMRTSSRNRVEELAAFAAACLPLKTIASGPALEMGLGQAYQIYNCLDFIVQDLDQFDGVGLPLIDASLQSPVIRNRVMAIKALEHWRAESWINTDTARIIKFLASKDPDEEIRQDAKNLLKRI